MTEPPITIRAAHDSGTPNLPPTRVVIHATCPDVGYSAASAPGAQHGTALYFAHPPNSNVGSAHYVCGVDGEEHCVPEDVVAWHAPPNPHSLGIEITAEGGNYARNYSRDQWLSPQVWPAVQRAAARCRDLCDRYGIPKVRLTTADLLAGKHGICGHVDVSNAWHQTDHTDPGPDFPWDRFMAEVGNPTPQEDDVVTTDDIEAIAQRTRQVLIDGSKGWSLTHLQQITEATDTRVVALGQAVAKLAAQDPGQITAADIAAAIPDDIAQQVVDALIGRLKTSS